MSARTALAPGRVNLVGEHTDYNDGLALPFAIAQGVTVHAVRIAEPRIEAHAVDLGERDAFALHDEPAREPGWRAFVRGTVAELRRAGVDVAGARLRIGGDVPRGAGLASSAALGVALALALGGDALDALELARLCSRVENEWVGAQTGLLDQLASLHGEPGAALVIDFRAPSVERVPCELGDWSLAVLGSGARHTHAEGGYNARRAEMRRARERLGVASLRDADPAAVASLPEPLDRRVRHVLEENARVEAAAAALRAGDVAALGPLLEASHASLRDAYEVSVPEVEAARSTLLAAGATGARMIGGGFGGSVLGLFPPGSTPPPGALAVQPAAGARVLAG